MRDYFAIDDCLFLHIHIEDALIHNLSHLPKFSALAILLAMSMRDLFAHMTEEDVEQLRKENTNTAEEKVLSSETVEMIEAKTEVGGSKLVPKYRKGTSVLYKTQQGIIGVLILDVHMDDLLEPYYTIKLPDGKEKQ